MDKVVIICGPTAVGKTKLSINIAKHYQTDIINGDAYQVYKEMSIGTAKPTLEERENVIHHLMDIKSASEEFDVVSYQFLVREKINDLIKDQKLPLIVGGSGLYIDSVISNYEFTGMKRDNDNELVFKDYSNEELHNYLNNLNPTLACTIHMNNRKRVLRAIEKTLHEGVKEEKRHELLYDALIICLNDERDKLYDRINQRVDEMMKIGLLEEVDFLKTHNLLSKTSREAIGYKELLNYLDSYPNINNLCNEELSISIENIKKNSRHYAKRQLTWFRHHQNVTEVMINTNDFSDTINKVITLIDEFIKKK